MNRVSSVYLPLILTLFFLYFFNTSLNEEKKTILYKKNNIKILSWTFENNESLEDARSKAGFEQTKLILKNKKN